MDDQEQLVICTLAGSHIVWTDCTTECISLVRQQRPDSRSWCCRCYRCGEYFRPGELFDLYSAQLEALPFRGTDQTLEEWDND